MARAAPRGEPPEPRPPPPATEELGGPPSGAASGLEEEPGPGPGPGQPPPQARRPSGAPRRVLFADEALGLPLAQLRRYQPWSCAGLGAGPSDEDEDEDDDDESPAELGLSGSPPGAGPGPPFYLLPGFVLPPAPGRLERLRGSMVELEDLLPPEDPGTPGQAPVLRGLIRVLNLSYHKAVHVRATHDGWLTFRDHPAHYVPGGSSSPEDGGQTDRFAFQLPFEPASVGAQVQDGARIDFVVRYQTPEATYWANNQGKNYTVVLKETSAARAKGLGLPVPPVPPPTAKHLLWEVETKQLKSCMKPVRHRQTEEELRRGNVDDPVSSMECPDDGDRGSGSIVVTPLPLQPGPQIIQVSDVMAASSRENKGSHLCLPETFLDYPQSPTIEIPPSALSLVPDQGGALGVPLLGTEEEALSDLASPLGARPSEGHPGKCTDLFRSDEAQPEDAVDLELEQLYLTHLSRLRAAEVADGDSGGIPITDPDQDLFLKWMGPERALNSSLAEEITLHYAMQSVQGVMELLEDAKEGSSSSGGEVEELEASSGAEEEEEEEEESGEGDTLKESPPGIVTGMWLAGQHPGFILVKDGLSQDPEEEEILGSGHSWSYSWAAPEKKPSDTEKECGQISAIKAEGPSSCFQERSDFLPNSIPTQKPSGIAQGGSLWEFPSQLQRALSQSLCVLGLLVFLPIMWNACMAFMGLAFYLSLAWFS
ncbi:protein phosphatase 1 regulatory subunit 3F [Trichosurus vulpecula]|uniref:protein phosphatase 1 regulatory subunit 3F n=1 Tax=Trichosurus vulpecula TaxID=9337 RepID=UPI00186AE244|nr:protein phosphatase 1 regulatory subunit 3F [Trichosurus vulpecula]